MTDTSTGTTAPSTQERIEQIQRQVERGKARAKTHGRLRFLFLLEGTGLTFSVFILLFKYVFPWFPATTLGFLVWATIYGIVLNGYNDAQRRAIDNSTEDKDLGKDDLLGRDTLFSSLPFIAYGLIFAITMFGLVLKYRFHAFDDPSSGWIEDRLIGPGMWAWGFWVLSVPFFWAFWGDLTKGQKLFVRLTRRGGMQTRNENPGH